MKVSIIVPVYNTEKYLSKCLDSLINQDFSDYEIIIVNDGSTDNSEDIINDYANKYDNIKTFKKKNGGLSSARNYGLAKAIGKYITFVDSDDYVEKDFLKELYNAINKDNSDIAVCEFSYVYSSGKVIRSYSNLNYTEDTLKKYLLTPPMAPIRMFKKELFEYRKFKERIYYEDLDLCPKFAKIAKKVSFVDLSLYNYLMRDNSIMHQKELNSKLNDIYQVLDSNYNELFNDYPDEIEYMYIIHLLRTASLRFLDYKEGESELIKIINIIKEKFPNWSSNEYFKKSNIKIKLICYLAYYKRIGLLKIIKRVTGK